MQSTYIENKKEKIDDILTQNRLLLAGLAFIPLVAATYYTYRGIKKGIGWFIPRAHDYGSPIKIAVDKLANLLLDCQNEMEMENVGRLLFLVYTLQREVKYIPEEKQEQFLYHLQQLKNMYYTIEHKRKIIDQMYREYDFLALRALNIA